MVEEHAAKVRQYEAARDAVREHASDPATAYQVAFTHLADHLRTARSLEDVRPVVDGLVAGLDAVSAHAGPANHS